MICGAPLGESYNRPNAFVWILLRGCRARRPRPRGTIEPMTTRRRVLARAAAAALSLVLPACRPDARENAETGATPSTRSAEKAAFRADGLRVDLRHAVRAGEESFEIVNMRAEPAPSTRGDAPDWGDYRFALVDKATGALRSLSGFESNIAADAAAAATELSVRCALPTAPFTIAIEKRRAGNVFQTLLSTSIDPAAASIDRTPTTLPLRVDSLTSQGDPREKVDLAIIGDGYTELERDKFTADAKRASSYLFAVEPFKSRVRDFNVHVIFLPSADSGVSDAYLGVRRNTALHCAYGGGEAERTLAVGAERRMRDAASAVPYDVLLVLANSRRYGGSAYYGGPAVVAIDSAFARYLVVHEFAHALAGLAEEYYIPDANGPAYRGNVEPWYPNVTTSLQTDKWRAPERAAADWNKLEYDRIFAAYVKRYAALRASGADEAAIEKLMSEARGRQGVLLRQTRDVGLFEGANGYSRGMFRSEADCIMFSLQTQYYCAACTAALNRALDAHIRR